MQITEIVGQVAGWRLWPSRASEAMCLVWANEMGAEVMCVFPAMIRVPEHSVSSLSLADW